ncbi:MULTISPECIES: potassium channel family protein [unclassified Coleofasciculus]|uniref:potassium channel family protein n=1 Tax=unclassified Coleofasciculus TaxID=2692782 RepID=UPI001880EB87|nr:MULTISPECIES: NAD-binding protein [unclassified Coleofasciculus]MBE9128294.1 NAD-binding protein [Coleofasciculus sp. LEGE 07081]MBE9151338.1 NAD-binding protein [Coleofasciculus sp. LEGE 07092]
MKPRIIVCGLGRTGYKIFCLLRQQGAAVVGISDRLLPGDGHHVITGDLRAASTLLAAGIQDAQTLILTSSDDALNLAILTQARILNPRVQIINRLFNTSLGDRLDQILPNHVSMSVASLAAPVFAFAAMGNRAIGQLRLFNQTWPIHEEYIYDTHPWIGRPLSDLWEERSRMLIYYLPVKGQVNLISAVVQGQTLQAGDRLIVGTQPSTRSRRNSWLRKLLKVITNLRQFRRHGQPIVVGTLLLLVTILIATGTYVSVNLNTSFVDALYFSVGMITGAGGQEKVAEQAPDSIKVFTSVMMLVGAGVIGICYALFNDFLLGTRFNQFWDAARVPNRNHYVICGLGGTGVQIVNQLHTNGYEVVVLERDPNNRFLGTARSLGVPVIVGDASLGTTLEAANIHKAEALLAVTSNDMTNVEISLSAKALASNLPIVVRNNDPQFASGVQKVFNFEVVLSPTELATPSFAAAALGGRILGNGMTGDTLWVALAMLITAAHPFCGRRVKDVSMDADFVPLYIETQFQTIHGWDLLEIALSGGDILYLTMPANQLEQLWRVTPSKLLAS